MKKLKLNSKILVVALACSALALIASGCSDSGDKSAKKPKTETSSVAKPNHNPNPFDHSGEAKVTDSEKQKFEEEFSRQCVARELKHTANPEDDKQRLEQSCTCIATFMMNGLTAQEAEKFLSEHENPQSLRIKYENAAYHCLQQSAPHKGPNFSRPPQTAGQ